MPAPVFALQTEKIIKTKTFAVELKVFSNKFLNWNLTFYRHNNNNINSKLEIRIAFKYIYEPDVNREASKFIQVNIRSNVDNVMSD